MANIENHKSHVLVLGTDDADSIYNDYYNVTVDAGAGNDTIRNTTSWYSGVNAIIDAGKGNDSIYNDASNVSIDAGAGNDSIENSGTSSFIIMGSGNDFITNGGGNVSIYAGSGNDTIRNYSSNALINGGKGDDFISLPSYSEFNVIEYKSGDGNDTIFGFKANDTLKIGDGTGSYSTQKSGDNLIVSVGGGKIILLGAEDFSDVDIAGKKASTKLTVTNKTSSPVKIDSSIKTIDATKRTTAVKITGNALDNTIKGGSGKDTLAGGKGDDKIFGNAGNDSLSGGDGNDTLSGGAGNDKLRGGSGKDTLSGGDGKDSLWGGADNDTLYGGDGDDVFIFRAGEGTDKIMDFTGGDMLQILNADGSEGTFTNSSFKSGKLTLAIEGGGHVTFSGMSAGDEININGTMHTISGKKLI